MVSSSLETFSLQKSAKQLTKQLRITFINSKSAGVSSVWPTLMVSVAPHSKVLKDASTWVVCLAGLRASGRSSDAWWPTRNLCLTITLFAARAIVQTTYPSWLGWSAAQRDTHFTAVQWSPTEDLPGRSPITATKERSDANYLRSPCSLPMSKLVTVDSVSYLEAISQTFHAQSVYWLTRTHRRRWCSPCWTRAT